MSLFRKLQIYIATAGEVVGRNSNGTAVKVGDSTILLTLVENVKNGEVEELLVPKFRIGSRFNNRGLE